MNKRTTIGITAIGIIVLVVGKKLIDYKRLSY